MKKNNNEVQDMFIKTGAIILVPFIFIFAFPPLIFLLFVLIFSKNFKIMTYVNMFWAVDYLREWNRIWKNLLDNHTDFDLLKEKYIKKQKKQYESDYSYGKIESKKSVERVFDVSTNTDTEIIDTSQIDQLKYNKPKTYDLDFVNNIWKLTSVLQLVQSKKSDESIIIIDEEIKEPIKEETPVAEEGTHLIKKEKSLKDWRSSLFDSKEKSQLMTKKKSSLFDKK